MRGGGKSSLEAVLDRPVADRNGKMSLAAAGLAVKDQRTALGDEVRSEIRAEQRGTQIGLQGEVEVVDGLEIGKVGATRQPLQPCLLAMRHFLGDEQGEEVPVGPLLLFGARDHLAIDPAQVRQVETLEQRVELDFGKSRARM